MECEQFDSYGARTEECIEEFTVALERESEHCTFSSSILVFLYYTSFRLFSSIFGPLHISNKFFYDFSQIRMQLSMLKKRCNHCAFGHHHCIVEAQINMIVVYP